MDTILLAAWWPFVFMVFELAYDSMCKRCNRQQALCMKFTGRASFMFTEG